MTARGWTDAQKMAYLLADNQLPMNAGWDPDLLRMEIRELEALNFDIGKIGFDTDALAKLFDVGEPVEREERQRDGLGEAVIHMPLVHGRYLTAMGQCRLNSSLTSCPEMILANDNLVGGGVIVAGLLLAITGARATHGCLDAN